MFGCLSSAPLLLDFSASFTLLVLDLSSLLMTVLHFWSFIFYDILLTTLITGKATLSISLSPTFVMEKSPPPASCQAPPPLSWQTFISVHPWGSFIPLGLSLELAAGLSTAWLFLEDVRLLWSLSAWCYAFQPSASSPFVCSGSSRAGHRINVALKLCLYQWPFDWHQNLHY